MFCFENKDEMQNKKNKKAFVPALKPFLHLYGDNTDYFSNCKLFF